MHSHNHHVGGHCKHGHAHVRAAFGGHGKHGFAMGGHHGFGVHGGFGGHGGRARRGDVRTAILRLLSEEPMHGYQIIQELSNRSGGAWSPSAGSVYPTLQMLADEGLVSAEEASGKKVFSLTEAGTAAVAAVAGQPAPWEEAAQSDASGGLREQMPKLAAAIMQISMSGDTDKIARAVEIVADTRKKLYAILAED